ncbi:MAG: hypothetical protein JW881_10790 [Spirochaetales bacterium]|nr:hypothetical protein [Spirochaetales bacterium]
MNPPIRIKKNIQNTQNAPESIRVTSIGIFPAGFLTFRDTRIYTGISKAYDEDGGKQYHDNLAVHMVEDVRFRIHMGCKNEFPFRFLDVECHNDILTLFCDDRGDNVDKALRFQNKNNRDEDHADKCDNGLVLKNKDKKKYARDEGEDFKNEGRVEALFPV